MPGRQTIAICGTRCHCLARRSAAELRWFANRGTISCSAPRRRRPATHMIGGPGGYRTGFPVEAESSRRAARHRHQESPSQPVVPAHVDQERFIGAMRFRDQATALHFHERPLVDAAGAPVNLAETSFKRVTGTKRSSLTGLFCLRRSNCHAKGRYRALRSMMVSWGSVPGTHRPPSNWLSRNHPAADWQRVKPSGLPGLSRAETACRQNATGRQDPERCSAHIRM